MKFPLHALAGCDECEHKAKRYKPENDQSGDPKHEVHSRLPYMRICFFDATILKAPDSLSARNNRSDYRINVVLIMP